MATTVSIHDDLDHSAGARTVRFGLAGVEYEIDLSATNRKALERALRPYIRAARKTSVREAATGTARAPRRRKHDLTAVRAWAAENGYQVAERGRVPAAVIEAYMAAR